MAKVFTDLIVSTYKLIVEDEFLESNFENFSVRPMSFLDADEFKRACLASPKELTDFLSVGESMQNFIFSDYWNLLFNSLKDPETNSYGLFEGKKLIGFCTSYPSNKPLGRQLVYWIRNGFHGRGLGRYFVENLINRITNINGFEFIQLIIDRDNLSSIKVAESLNLFRFEEWEGFESGQGKLNSGKFCSYYAFSDDTKAAAAQIGIHPILVLQQLWYLMAAGVIQVPEIEARSMDPSRNRIVQTLRFVRL